VCVVKLIASLPFRMRHLFSLLHHRHLLSRSRFRPKSRPSYNAMSVEPHDLETGPLVWIDCEMTGLNPRKDKLLEIAVCILSLLSFRLSLRPLMTSTGSHHDRKPSGCRRRNPICHQNGKGSLRRVGVSSGLYTSNAHITRCRMDEWCIKQHGKVSVWLSSLTYRV
jgi:hypothetical protein